jgi:hypothetical protein
MRQTDTPKRNPDTAWPDAPEFVCNAVIDASEVLMKLGACDPAHVRKGSPKTARRAATNANYLGDAHNRAHRARRIHDDIGNFPRKGATTKLYALAAGQDQLGELGMDGHQRGAFS